MLTIPDRPDRPICSTHGPLRWGWFTDTRQGARWVSFTFDPGGVLVPHVCDNPEPTPTRWQPDPVVAERAHRGRALVDAALAGQELIEKEDRR